MNAMNIIFFIFLTYICVYIFFYSLFLSRLQKEEAKIVELFLKKISKIPSVIEVMRPDVVDISAFDAIIELHSQAMIHRYDTIYDLLEHNARIEHEFGFLMRLSMQIPKLQKDKYFVYIRDFVMQYERDMRLAFSTINKNIDIWNQFIRIKNYTGIGLILPGSKKIAIR